jgi:hypothetical protein
VPRPGLASATAPSALTLRTSRRMISDSEVRQPTHPLRRKSSLHFSTVVLTRNGAHDFFHSFRAGHRPPDLPTDPWTGEQVSATIIRRPLPTPSALLSKNTSAVAELTVLDTLGQLYAHSHGLSGYCRSCRRFLDVRMPALIAAPGPDSPVVGMRPLRCAGSLGREAEIRVTAPSKA